MNKLVICSRTNWENKCYIKIKASKNSIKTLKNFTKSIGDDYFVDNQGIPNTVSNYDKWKDYWIPVVTKDIGIDIICGDRYIHMIFYKFSSFSSINKIMENYFEWI